ncbi:MAG TPA: MmgE/PrpD family protein [Burkholderiales bacterium]|nr:MmgE/PrpD family protein [Burkholderiales bacterium]
MKRDTERPELLAAGEATRSLGAYAAGLRYADLPPVVSAKAKECVLDALGCCLLGMTQPWTRMVLDMVMEQGGTPQASVLGTAHRTSASQAALVTATAGHGFELDDIHVQAHLHPGSLTVPVALAVGEMRGSVGGKLSGRDFLAAVVAGYEVALRVGLAATGSHFLRGYHFQGTCGAFGAAATAANVLGLDAEKTQHALGIAGSQAAGLMAAQEGAMAKRMHGGRAAQSGVYSALLAARGFTGIPNVLEAPYGGFLSAFTDSAQPSHLTEGYGSRWEILKVGYKPYASAASTHTALYSLLTIMKENGLKAADIGEIHLLCSTMAVRHCAWEYVPQGVTSAQMSLYYTLAAMAHDGEVLTDQFAESRLSDPGLLAFMRRIRIEADPQYDRGGDLTRHQSHMTVATTDGRRFEKDAPLRKGSPDFPMTTEERHTKFRRLASAALPAARVDGIIREVEALDGAANIAPLIALLKP